MKPTHVAILLVRYYCLWSIIDAIVVLVELPTYIFGVVGAPAGYLTTQRELALLTMLGRFAIYLSTAVLGLIFTRPLAKVMTTGLDAA